MRYKQPNPKKVRRTNRTYSHDALVRAYQEIVENGMPVKTAARLFQVPRTTLRDRVSGKVHPDTVTTGKPPLFTLLEEARLVNHIKKMASYGYGYTRQECVNLACDLAVQLGKHDKKHQLSLKWIRGFLNRWPELKVLKPRNLEYSRARMASKATVSAYFDNLEQSINEHSLCDKPHLIFNLDEKGITTEHKPPCIVGSATYCPPAVTSGRGRTVTVLGCISASGVSLPPFFVFPGKRMNQKLLKGKSPGADGTVSESGWSNQAIFRHYLMNHFTKHIPGRDDQKVLLIMDGHKSHVSVGLCEWAKEKGIIFFYLPPHTSHILQPLDVACYGPFERIFNNECHKLMRQAEATLNMYNVCEVACQVYTKALSPENAQSAFKRTGIYPLDKDAIPAEHLIPAEIYQDGGGHDETEIDSQDTVEGGVVISIRRTVEDGEEEKEAEGADAFQIFARKESELRQVKCEKEAKPRNTMSKIVAGREVTNEVLNKMKDHETMSKVKQRKQPVSRSNVTKRKQQPEKNSNGKKVKTVVPSVHDPQPGPSHVNLLVDTSGSDSESEDEQSLCCMCQKNTPVELANRVYVRFTKWAQCDGMRNGLPCMHWVHLTYCSAVRVIRRGDTFLCPHCEKEE